MKPLALKMKCALALVIGGLLAVGPVMAASPYHPVASKGDRDDRDDRRGKGHRGDNDDRRDRGSKGERRDDDRNSRRGRDDRSDGKRHFEERHTVVVREYYTERYRDGRCPPGLRKKNNGCMPPGQAKKWKHGRPLPREVIYYEVPQPLVVQIGVPPPGYRYVRVSSDILMIAIGTGIVVDAIQNLGW